MKYSKSEVLDIIKSCCSEDAETILINWERKKSDTPLNLEKYSYPLFVYSFPLIIEGEEVATITLVDLYYGGNLEKSEMFLMPKYFGIEEYEKSWKYFSHDTLKFCYLTIHKKFKLTEIVEGFFAGTYKSVDAEGEEFEFRISYGYPEKENDGYMYESYVDKAYRFDNDVNIQFLNGPKNGWSLGEKINERINERIKIMNYDNNSKTTDIPN